MRGGAVRSWLIRCSRMLLLSPFFLVPATEPVFPQAAPSEPTNFKARVDAALATYRRAEERIRALQPPPSLERAHSDYLAAVELFQKSALEVEKMFDDGNDEHLLAPYPLSQEGSDKIREIGVRFWQDEFPPN